MITAAVHAIVIVACAAVLFAAAVIAAAMLRPEPPGRHRLDGEKTAAHFRSLRTETPAPVERPGQVRPGDPRAATRAVRAGATPLGPGVPCPAPEAAAHASAPVDDAAAVLPAPHQVPAPGAGQHAFRPVIMQFPGGEVGILGADGRWNIKPLAWQPGIRETGAQPALVRGPRVAFEAWQDRPVNEL